MHACMRSCVGSQRPLLVRMLVLTAPQVGLLDVEREQWSWESGSLTEATDDVAVTMLCDHMRSANATPPHVSCTGACKPWSQYWKSVLLANGISYWTVS